MREKPVICFLATHEKLTVHFPGLNVQVPIRVWLPVVVCAAAWPIKFSFQCYYEFQISGHY